ncbi:hypothetical protein Sango_2231900 [Sesamum angolense]|uniref:RanBP2-type domain-containing protein n=1 Tax=Sesamum angolense TaxID=2727404 RepID=A0AAE1W971_9LAMI|nr:hypothetical protein Sango_2231900 [Sesamum angolense]
MHDSLDHTKFDFDKIFLKKIEIEPIIRVVANRVRQEIGGDYGSFGGRGGSSFGFTGPDVRPGDWYCSVGNCGAHNFASRSSCFKCGALKDDGAGGGGGFDGEISRARGFGFGGGSRSGWKSGDWICTRSGCNEHNFASRMECFRCNAPRESSGNLRFDQCIKILHFWVYELKPLDEERNRLSVQEKWMMNAFCLLMTS